MSTALPLDRVLPLRWAGGKRSLVPILRLFAAHLKTNRLVDPFAGGASFLVGIDAPQKLGADTNEDLINFYQECKRDHGDLLAELSKLEDTAERFYEVRKVAPLEARPRAARFLYLNRTAYMGLHRTNQHGDFNVPYGGGGRLDLKSLGLQLENLSKALEGVQLQCQDFRLTLDCVREGDFVVLDPPYGHSGDLPFRRYGREIFSFQDHLDLSNAAKSAVARGALAAVTLPADSHLTTLYSGWIPYAIRTTKKGTEVLLVSADSSFDERNAPKTNSSWRILSSEDSMSVGQSSLPNYSD